jgi:hypothetical protein
MKAFLFVTIVMTLSFLIPVIGSLLSFRLHGISIVGVMILTWWLAYYYLISGAKLAFWLSFVLLNLYWLPLLIQIIRKIHFIIEYGKTDNADGGFFLVYLGVLFVSVTIGMMFACFAIRNIIKSQTKRETANFLD